MGQSVHCIGSAVTLWIPADGRWNRGDSEAVRQKKHQKPRTRANLSSRNSDSEAQDSESDDNSLSY